MLRTKNLNLLPVLLALLEEESVVAAADRVHLSQPAVSGALAKLRKEFNDPLLLRVGRGMRRTSRGQRLLPLVRQSCAELERLFDFGIFDPTQTGSRFVIAAPDHLSFFVTQALGPILQFEAPNARVHFVEPPFDLPTHLANRSIDLAIAGNFGVWTEASYERVFEEQFVAAMSADHPLASRAAVEAHDIEEFARIGRAAGPLSGPDGAALLTGIPVLDLDPQISIEQFTEAALLAIGTDLVVPAPMTLVETLGRFAPIVGIPFVEDYHVEAGLFWAPFRDDEPEIQWLRSLILRCLAPFATTDEPSQRLGR